MVPGGETTRTETPSPTTMRFPGHASWNVLRRCLWLYVWLQVQLTALVGQGLGGALGGQALGLPSNFCEREYFDISVSVTANATSLLVRRRECIDPRTSILHHLTLYV